LEQGHDGTGNYYPDNTTGNPYSPTELINHSITLDDDRVLSVNNISVNEGSPYAVFTVSGVSGQNVKLELTSGTATLGTDTHNAGTNVSLQYYNGSSWVDYTANSYVAIPDGGTTLLVRTVITNDSTYEGAEIFTLTATNTGGTSVIGTGTIHDDGTGNYYPDNTTGNPYSPTELINHNITLDDDRGIGVTSLGDVNENSSYAMFVVQSNAGQTLTLGLSNGTATLSNETIQFSYDGTHWTTYYNSTLPIVPENGKFYVRNTIFSEVDSSYEGSENFSLVVTNSVNTSISGRDSTNIKDDGTGNKFTGNITDPTNNTPATNNITLDDDRGITVSGLNDVSEGSNSIFTVMQMVQKLVYH
jgi:hypothetical protein